MAKPARAKVPTARSAPAAEASVKPSGKARAIRRTGTRSAELAVEIDSGNSGDIAAVPAPQAKTRKAATPRGKSATKTTSDTNRKPVAASAPTANAGAQPAEPRSHAQTQSPRGPRAGADTKSPDGRSSDSRPSDADASLFGYIVRDPEAFARNVARIVENAGKAAAAYLRPRESGERRANSEELATVFKTLGHVREYWMAEPSRAFEAQSRLWMGYMDVWNATLKRLSGEAVEPAVKPDPRDKRFQDPEWSSNQFFDFVKQMYLTTSRWADDMVERAEGLDEHTRQKAEFYVRQISDAIAPSNFVMTSPELLRETLAENGENLVRGMEMLAEDIAAGNGDLKIRQTSSGNFRLGENLATTPGKVIFENDVCQIIQYEPATPDVHKRPLLIVPPWINKFYILDLSPEKSFIKWVIEQGRTVFVVSWVNPDRRQAEKSFEQYMKEGILAGVDVVEAATGEREVDTIGYCVGGTLLAVTLAWCAETGDDRIRSATLFTTQVDFTYAGGLKTFVDEEQVRIIEEMMQERGYLDGQKMAASFNMLRSNDLIWPYFINNYMKGREPFPFDLLYWNSDATRMPAANHSFYLRNCYLENNLSKGLMEIGGIKLDLKKVTIPIYNLAAREDHIAPAKSVFVGSSLFGGPVDYVLSGSGHIAGVINPPARKKYQFWTGGAPVGTFEAWVEASSETPGSWWPHWSKWLDARSSGRVAARTPGGGRFKVIEDAPGTYVTVKA